MTGSFGAPVMISAKTHKFTPPNKNRLRKTPEASVFLAAHYRGRLIYFFFLAGAFFEAFFAAFLVAFFIERFSLT